MKKILLLLLLVVLQQSWGQKARTLFITEVKVISKKDHKKHWDSWKGAPDLMVIVWVYDKQWKKVMISPVVKDSYAITKTLKANLGTSYTKVEVQVFDKDIRKNDKIGSKVLSIDKLNILQRTKFSGVTSLKYMFSDKKTLQQAKDARLREITRKKLETERIKQKVLAAKQTKQAKQKKILETMRLKAKIEEQKAKQNKILLDNKIQETKLGRQKAEKILKEAMENQKQAKAAAQKAELEIQKVEKILKEAIENQKQAKAAVHRTELEIQKAEKVLKEAMEAQKQAKEAVCKAELEARKMEQDRKKTLEILEKKPDNPVLQNKEKKEEKPENYYYIIRIRGTIEVLPSGRLLGVGGKIHSDEKVRFGKKAMALVISPVKGRMVLKPGTKQKKAESELLSVLFPPRRIAMSTRAFRLKYTGNLKEHFLQKPYVILGKKTRIRLNPKHYPLSVQNYFLVKYRYQEQMVTKKLEYDGEWLIISGDNLFSLEGQPVDPALVSDFHIMYHEAGKNIYLGSFHPSFLENKELLEEISIMIEVLQEAGKTTDEIEKEILSFIMENYGFVGWSNLEDWLAQNFKTFETRNQE